jgi:hypothetical protein
MVNNDTKHALDVLALSLEQRPELVLALRDTLVYIASKGGDVDTFFNQWRNHVIATQIETQRSLQAHTRALEASKESNLAYVKALKESAEHAKSYASHVLIIGYFGFFSLWYFVADKGIITTFLHSLIGFLMTLSIMLFLLYDVVIRIWNEKDTPNGKTVEYWLSAVIPTIFGYSALGILGFIFLTHLLGQMFK